MIPVYKPIIGKEELEKVINAIKTNWISSKGEYIKKFEDNFAKKVEGHRYKVVGILRDLKKQGKKLVGISSPAKGNTLLNYCNIGRDILDYITEKSILKVSKYTPGIHIPIVGEEKLLEDKPDYGLILAWNFTNEIMKNNEKFKQTGESL